MNEQQIQPGLRINNAIDRDVMDAKITLNLIEKLTEQSNHPQTLVFSDEELQTLIRNCVHAIILNFTKTIEEPRTKTVDGEKIQTYNLESLIERECHAENRELLKGEVCKIRGDRVYGKLVEYRLKIIAHRNIRGGGYRKIEQEFAECKDYLLKYKGHIEKLIEENI